MNAGNTILQERIFGCTELQQSMSTPSDFSNLKDASGNSETGQPCGQTFNAKQATPQATGLTAGKIKRGKLSSSTHPTLPASQDQEPRIIKDGEDEFVLIKPASGGQPAEYRLLVKDDKTYPDYYGTPPQKQEYRGKGIDENLKEKFLDEIMNEPIDDSFKEYIQGGNAEYDISKYSSTPRERKGFIGSK